MQPHKAQQLATEAIAAGYDITAARRWGSDDWVVTMRIGETSLVFSAYGQWADYRRHEKTHHYFTARRNYEYCDRCHAEDLADCTCKEGPHHERD